MSIIWTLPSICLNNISAQSGGNPPILQCGTYAAAPPNGNNPDSLIYDRFGNAYDFDDLLIPVPLNGVNGNNCPSGFFNLVFEADFPLNM
jgi:hypothetical protein